MQVINRLDLCKLTDQLDITLQVQLQPPGEQGTPSEGDSRSGQMLQVHASAPRYCVIQDLGASIVQAAVEAAGEGAAHMLLP